ncbi:MAG: hypothetical protein ACK5QG_12785, partial [Bacteroidota bacterium]|nr:hypothetical protein [Flammeovirgaceae bacterium]MCZ8071647.1 hypothetical protein [Cytophagales bacterium]
PLFSSMPHPYCSKSWSPPELSSSSGEAGILSTFNLKSTNHFSVHYQTFNAANNASRATSQAPK